MRRDRRSRRIPPCGRRQRGPLWPRTMPNRRLRPGKVRRTARTKVWRPRRRPPRRSRDGASGGGSGGGEQVPLFPAPPLDRRPTRRAGRRRWPRRWRWSWCVAASYPFPTRRRRTGRGPKSRCAPSPVPRPSPYPCPHESGRVVACRARRAVESPGPGAGCSGGASMVLARFLPQDGQFLSTFGTRRRTRPRRHACSSRSSTAATRPSARSAACATSNTTATRLPTASSAPSTAPSSPPSTGTTSAT